MFIDTLVAQALDDLEEDRLDIETALRTVAWLAWQDGYRQALPPTTTTVLTKSHPRTR
jgi:hypothetical protein